MSATCPYCGNEMEGRVDPHQVADLLGVNGKSRIILNILTASFGKDVPNDRLVSAVYADDINGGPMDAAGVVSQFKFRLRQMIAPLGLVIKGRGGVTRLEWSDAPGALRRERACRISHRVVWRKRK